MHKASFFQAVRRGIVGEVIRIGGLRGAVMRVSVPLAFAMPLLITWAVALAAQVVNQADGLVKVRQVHTENSVYWIIFFGVTLHAIVAAYAQSHSHTGALGKLSRQLNSDLCAVMCARWVVWGFLAAVLSFIAVMVTLVMLPLMFSEVYSEVSMASSAGIRFLWAVPAYACMAVGIGLGVGALIPLPAAAVTGIALWSFFIETAVIYVPHGARLVHWMPFMNGVYATGQQIALEPPWGPNGAMMYVCAIAGAIFLIGWGAQRRRIARSF